MDASGSLGARASNSGTMSYSCRQAQRINSGQHRLADTTASENRGARKDDTSQRQGFAGSLGWVLNRSDLTSRNALNAAGTLIASPTAASSRTRRRDHPYHGAALRPRAIRIPITYRRFPAVTLCDIIPYSPTHAISSARTAKPVHNFANVTSRLIVRSISAA